jgi:hypothetical protein
MSKASSMPHACTVLVPGKGDRHLYQFAVQKGAASPAGQIGRAHV